MRKQIQQVKLAKNLRKFNGTKWKLFEIINVNSGIRINEYKICKKKIERQL